MNPLGLPSSHHATTIPMAPRAAPSFVTPVPVPSESGPTGSLGVLQLTTTPHKTPPGKGADIIPIDRARGRLVDLKALASPRLDTNDAHFHPSNYVHQGPSLLEMIDMMDRAGIHRCVLAPLPTRQMLDGDGKAYRPALGQPSHGCNYYIPDPKIRFDTKVSSADYWDVVNNSPAMAHDTECDTHTAVAFQRLDPKLRQRFDPMVTGLNLGDLRCSDSLVRKLGNAPGVFTGVGEITVHKEFVQHKLPMEHQARLVPGEQHGRKFQPYSDALKKLIQTCGDIGMPMIIHNDAGPPKALRTSRDDSTLYFDPAVELYRQPECRNTTIIWAHAGGAGKYSHLDEWHVDRLDMLLGDPRLQHVNIDLSWDVVAHQLTRDDGTAKGSFDKAKALRWAALFDKYPDRVLYGSDSLAPTCHEHWQSTADIYKDLLQLVKPETARKIKYDNYERIFVGARARVRAWERYCLPMAEKVLLMRDDPHHNNPDYAKRFADEKAHLAKAMPVARLAMELELANGDTTAPKVVAALQDIRAAAAPRAVRAAKPELPASDGAAAATAALGEAQRLVASHQGAPLDKATAPLRARL